MIKMKDILSKLLPIDIVKDFGNEILEYCGKTKSSVVFCRNGRLEDWMDERLDIRVQFAVSRLVRHNPHKNQSRTQYSRCESRKQHRVLFSLTGTGQKPIFLQTPYIFAYTAPESPEQYPLSVPLRRLIHRQCRFLCHYAESRFSHF